ncbi:TIGR02680 family protein [Amycolatopsis sp. NPDC000673]|uniref:TIGR02680 family protein n=1 Tax=Amycolatopsis sp. NPDC000673 TaxID=3154267 RepID=UPI00331D30F4
MLVKPLLRAAVQSREEQLRAVEEGLDGHERAVERRGQAEEELEQARSAFSAAKEELDLAAEQRTAALEQLRTDALAWASACRELPFPEPDLLLDLLESERALNAEAERAVNTALEDITRQEASREARAAELRRRRDDSGAEIARLQSEKDLPPPAPPTRTADRTRMTGAPLWRLVDFSAASPEGDRAGIEAALEGAGLLDAWVGSRGEVQGHDVFADPDSLPAAAGRSLADVLSPEPDGEVPASVMRRLLASVGFGDVLPAEGPAAIGADGSWRLGNLTGSWRKERPAYIGAAARRRARELRIEELRNEILLLDKEIADVETELSALSLRRGTVRDERASLPPHTVLNAATRQFDRAEIGLAAADRLVRERIDRVGRREREVADALRTLTACAAEYGMPAERAALANLASATRAFRTACENWLESHDGLRSARQVLSSLATQADRSAGDARQRAEEAREAEEEYLELAATLEAVDSTAGVEYREVAAKIEKLRVHLDELETARKSTQSRHTELAIEVGEWRNRQETDAAEHEKAVADRDAAALRFRRLASGVFPADSGLNDLERFESFLDSSDGVRAALDAARLVTAAWPSVPHSQSNIGDALHRLSESMHTCRDVLHTRADLDLETDEDVQIFTAVVDGIRVGAAELLKILHAEAEESRREITERERELFDQTLTGDTRRHLAARIRQANELVENMNNRLEQVRTASKVAVRLVWQVATDLPPGTKAARDLLLKDPVRLTAADRESLHQFFRDRIEEAKADDTATGWEQQLAKVFDYTAWHRFVVKVDRANGEGWQPLTRKLHGALSGGEKAIALHLPLFAAVAAHYQAVPEAPRVILLDEVFVGVDTTNRGQVFALLSALDLDLMLTSDHEWCVYAELSGIGIHQLITGADGDDAVTTARFTWDGHQLRSIDAE